VAATNPEQACKREAVVHMLDVAVVADTDGECIKRGSDAYEQHQAHMCVTHNLNNVDFSALPLPLSVAR
jgi:hypothetical protein